MLPAIDLDEHTLGVFTGMYAQSLMEAGLKSVEVVARGSIAYEIEGIPCAVVVNAKAQTLEDLAQEYLAEQEEVATDGVFLSAEEVSLVKSLLAMVAGSKECYDLAGYLQDVTGETTDEECFRFVVGGKGGVDEGPSLIENPDV